jgi:intergrase/recombinase
MTGIGAGRVELLSLFCVKRGLIDIRDSDSISETIGSRELMGIELIIMRHTNVTQNSGLRSLNSNKN